MTKKTTSSNSTVSSVLKKRRQLIDETAAVVFEHVYGSYEYHLMLENSADFQEIYCCCVIQILQVLKASPDGSDIATAVLDETADRLRDRGLHVVRDGFRFTIYPEDKEERKQNDRN